MGGHALKNGHGINTQQQHDAWGQEKINGPFDEGEAKILNSQINRLKSKDVKNNIKLEKTSNERVSKAVSDEAK